MTRAWGFVASDPSSAALDRIGAMLVRRSPRTTAMGVGAVCAALVLLLRFLSQPLLGPGEALVTEFPLVLVAALTVGRRGGWTCLVLSTIGSWYFFIGEPFSFVLAPNEAGILTSTFVVGAFVIQICGLMRRAFQEIVELRATERLLSRELQHRIKNTLTLVLGIARQTFRTERPVDGSLRDFEDRMIALSAAQDLTGASQPKPVAMAEIVEKCLSPFCGGAFGQQVTLAGPPTIVDDESAVGLFLAFHELATNATKYGALSSRQGVVAVSWGIDGEAGARTLEIGWVERLGPTVVAPTREGFGSRLLDRIITRSLKGGLKVSYPTDGFRAEISLPYR